MTRIWSRPAGQWLVLGVSLASGSLASCTTLGEAEQPPVVAPPRPTPEQETQSVVEGVKKAGDPPAELKPILEKAAEAAFTQTFGPSDDTVMTERGGCFAAGCLFQVTYRDQCAAINFKHLFTEKAMARLRDWPGTIYRTPPIKLADGRIRMTWALLLTDAQAQRPRLEALLNPPIKQAEVIKPDVCVGANPAPAGLKNPTPMQGTK
jgi:hypothetical protein